MTKLSDFFSDDTIFVAYGQERRSNDDFNLNDRGKSELRRRQRSGINTIKYNPWPRAPYGKVTIAQENITYKRAKR